MANYNDITDALVRLNAIGDAAEIHGLLAAFLAAGIKVREQAWVNSLQTSHVEQGDVLAKEARDHLVKLYQTTMTGIEDTDLKFELLLPDDEASLEDRVEALAHWCQGFVSGLKLAEIPVENHPDKEVNEALKDLIEIAMIETDAKTAGDNEAEADFVVLKEYVRMAVMMVASLRDQEREAGEQIVH